MVVVGTPIHDQAPARNYGDPADLDYQRDLERAALLSARFLFRQILPTGRFIYRSDPSKPERQAPGYNLLRHAGSLYSLCQASSALEPTLHGFAGLTTAGFVGQLRLTSNYLLSFLRPLPGFPDTLVAWSVPRHNDTVKVEQVKLGGVALTLVALAGLSELDGTAVDRTVLHRLAAGLLAMPRLKALSRSPV